VYPAEPRRPEDGGEFVLYRIEHDKIPCAWLKEPLYEEGGPDSIPPPS